MPPVTTPPANFRPAAVNPKATASGAGASQPGRVLVAEDEHMIAMGLVSSLTQFGCEVDGPYPDGQSAVDSVLLSKAMPDLAILDIRMPRLDGLDAAKVIWEQHGIPVVIVSAFSDQTYIDRAQETGVFGYLTKPVSTGSLKTTLGIAWRRANEHATLEARLRKLEETLEHRRTVEQAKWKLVSEFHLTEPQAHQWLQKAARDNRRKLLEIANEVLTGKLHP